MDKQTFVSRGGAAVTLEVVDEGWVTNHDSRYVRFQATTETGHVCTIEVRFPQPPIIDHNARNELGFPFDQENAWKLAVVAVLAESDINPDAFTMSNLVVFNADDVYALPRRQRLTDKEVRRYLARVLYAAYREETLDVQVQLDELDYLITGATEKDFIRNAQVLAADDLVRVHLTMGPTLHTIQPTAKLVKETERWGGPQHDLAPPNEYEARIRAYPALRFNADSLVRERNRYLLAQSASELESVFRATAPIVEGIARNLLQALGTTRDISTLGPIIAEIQSRGLGGVTLLSQLNHVLKFGRDLSEHGHSIPEPVLRIACENAFDLAPQLGSLFPATGAADGLTRTMKPTGGAGI